MTKKDLIATSHTFQFSRLKGSFLQEAQERAYAEVADVLEQSDGKINHESVEGMSYTEAVINETLRMYAPVTNFARTCMKDCEVNVGDDQMLFINITK